MTRRPVLGYDCCGRTFPRACVVAGAPPQTLSTERLVSSGRLMPRFARPPGRRMESPQGMMTSDRNPLPGRARSHVSRSVAGAGGAGGAGAARGDSYVPEVPGLQDVRGGDIALPRPTWERKSIHALIREAAGRLTASIQRWCARWCGSSRASTSTPSPRGARGLMQLTSDTAREVGVTNPFDARQNVFGGTKT